MGVLAAALAFEEQRNWLTDDDWMFEGRPTASGVTVNRQSAMRQAAVWACVRLLTQTISTLPADIVVKMGRVRFALDRPDEQPSWLSAPNPSDPSLTWSEHIAQVVASLLLDGNFFVFVPGGIFDPSVLMVLDPSLVEVKRRSDLSPYYVLYDAQGQKVDEVDPLRMLHGTWVRMPGSLRGLNPIDAARQAIGAGLAAEDFGNRFFGQGATMSFGVELPPTYVVDDEKKKKLREDLTMRHAGSKNAHGIGVLTGGAKFVPGLGVTPEQAEFLDGRKFTVEEIGGRFFGIPPHKLGSQEPGAVSYNSVELRNLDYRQDAVLPITDRIEGQYARLVDVPDRLRASGATAKLKLNLDVINRADTKTRAEAEEIWVRSGQMTPDEARALEDRAPLPGGDKLYMQSQMVPIGDLGTAQEPVAVRAIAETSPPPPTAIEFRMADPAPPVINITMPPIEIPPTVVNVTVPEQPPAVVNVTTPEVRVEAAPTPNVVVDMSPFDKGLTKLGLQLRAPRSRKIEYDEGGRVSKVTES